ncbi:hypothetical protein G3I44_14290 [Halogeometricum borinquense]|uniref:Uncharacterized protein n=1 Tax=Halogeometricum borinquense TaxID=60847 RepID=A0A6C0UIT8_9EURY|nr:hypothetical protein [Halogeometricum borinquense]QIB75355.1 hypothetical protein G3I44_14290 [Halogeometricum borinquense]
MSAIKIMLGMGVSGASMGLVAFDYLREANGWIYSDLNTAYLAWAAIGFQFGAGVGLLVAWTAISNSSEERGEGGMK